MRPRTSFIPFVFLLYLIGVGMVPASAEVLPRGTVVDIRTTQPILADSTRPGTLIDGVVDRPVTVGRRVVIPRGARATLEVVERSSNRHRVDLSVRSIRVRGTHYVVSTNDVRLGSSSESTGSRRARRGVIGGGIGAAVGGIVGGGTGAAIGAATGAGIGIVSAGSGRTQLSVPAHTVLRFQLTRAASIGR
jgi:hypothetical protein